MIQFGKYTLLEKLAEGGMAEIFLAAHTGPGGFAKLVVIKRILPRLEVSPEFQQMLLDEARIAATLNHPNIVQTFEVDTVGDTLFIAMEHLIGEDVRALTTALAEPLPLGVALTLLLEACKGLTYAHEKTFGGTPLSIVHRDLSPRNLFVTYDGNVKILDFGVARARDRLSHTRTGEIKGSLPYMSPEQVRSSRELDHRSDLFTLGILLWELTTGERLFRGQADYDILRKIASDPIPRPSEVVPGYSAELEGVVMRLLDRDPQRRPAGCRELQTELEELALRLGVRTGSLVLSGLMTRVFPERIARARELERDLPSRLALQEHWKTLAGAAGGTGELTVNGRGVPDPDGDHSQVTRSDRLAVTRSDRVTHSDGLAVTRSDRVPPDPLAKGPRVAADIEVASASAPRAGSRRSLVPLLGLTALGVSGLVALVSWLATGGLGTGSRPATGSRTLARGPTPTAGEEAGRPARPAEVAAGRPAVPAEVAAGRPAVPSEVAATATAARSGADASGPPMRAGAAADRAPVTTAEPDTGAARVSIELETVPPGAEVRRGGRRLGVTPLQLSLPRDTAPVTLRLERRGHHVEELEIATTGDRRILRHLRRRGSLTAPRTRPSLPPGVAPRRGSGPDDLVDPFR